MARGKSLKIFMLDDTKHKLTVGTVELLHQKKFERFSIEQCKNDDGNFSMQVI